MTTVNKKVFIILLNFGGWPVMEECLKSLEKVEYDNFEMILIDNGSKEPMPFISVIPAKAGIQSDQLADGSPCIKYGASLVKPGMTSNVGEFTNLKIIQIYNKENLGFAGGNNQGIKIALQRQADYILLLNNDTTVEPDFLTKLVVAAEKNKDAGILGPIIYDYSDHSKIQFAGGKVNWSRTRGIHLIDYRLQSTVYGQNSGGSRSAVVGSRSVDYITGCCLLIKREVIEKIGFLSEDYFLYYEDTDWNMRAQRAGYKSILVSDAKIYHMGSKSSVEFSYPYIYYHSRNGLIFGSRFGNKFLIYLISIWIFAKQIVKLIIGYKRDWARPVMKGVLDFWRGKMGKLEGYY